MQVTIKNLFIFFCSLQVLISMDHGIIPASTLSIADSFQISQSRLGFMGSAVFLGIVANGVIAGRVYQLFHTKKVMIVGLVGSQLSLMLLIVTGMYYVALLARILTGAFQVFHVVFLPVWIDKYGGQKKTSWITIFQTCTPVGIFLGYSLTALLVEFYTWRLAFVIQILLILGSILVILQIDDQQLNIGGNHDESSQLDYMDNLKIVFKSKLYVICVLVFSVLLFVVTGIQFWMTDYYLRVLHAKKFIVNVGFVILSITAPTLGTIFGGVAINWIGGYTNPHTIKMLLVFCMICVVPSQFIPELDNIYIAGLMLWSLLFWGGAMIPGLTGLIMVSVPSQQRSFGNSKSELIKNLIGYFPSPFIYGLTIHLLDDNRAGFKMLMRATIIAPILLAWLLAGQIKIYGSQIQRIEEVQSNDDIQQ